MGSQPFPMGPTQHAPPSGPGMSHQPGPPRPFPGPHGQQMYPPRGPMPGMGMPWGAPMPGVGPGPVPQQSPWTSHMSQSGAPYYYNHCCSSVTSAGSAQLQHSSVSEAAPHGMRQEALQVTRESTWVRPPALAGPPPQAHAQPRPMQGFSAAQPTVVSADQVPGTNWKRVTCADGRVYFSNATTNTTVWTCPSEIAHLVPPTRPIAPQAHPQPRPGPPNNMPPSQRPEGAPPPLARPPPAMQPPPATPDLQQSPADPAAGPGRPPQMPQHHMGGNGPVPGPGPMNGPAAMHPGHGVAPTSPGWQQWPMHARPAWMPGQPSPANQAAAAAAKAEAEAAKEAADNVKHEFFELLLEHKINAFSRWEACKKFESDPRFQAVASKERKGLFNSFCANVVEETCKTEERARTAATKGLRDLFAELLNVTPLQFRLFREGKELEEVEAETVLQETERAQRLKAIVGEEPEDGEQGEDGHDKNASGQDSDEQLAVAASNANLDLVPGGLFTAGMKAEDVGELVPEDKRWSSASEELREELFAEVVGPMIEQRAELDAKTIERFEKRMHTWLSTQTVGGTSAHDAWEELKGLRPPLLALLPDRVCLHILKHYMEASRKSQKERDRQASAKAASESVTRRKREAEQNAEQRRQEAAKLTDEEAFRTLLFEAVKDPSRASWSSVKDKLRKDHGQRMKSRLITSAEYEKLFHSHVAALLQTARKQYTAALEELIRPALVDPDGNVLLHAEKGQIATDWTAASEVLASQPCFQKLSAQERRERWNAFVGAPDDALPMHPAHKRQAYTRDREQNRPPEAKRSRR